MKASGQLRVQIVEESKAFMTAKVDDPEAKECKWLNSYARARGRSSFPRRDRPTYQINSLRETFSTSSGSTVI